MNGTTLYTGVEQLEKKKFDTLAIAVFFSIKVNEISHFFTLIREIMNQSVPELLAHLFAP